MNTRSSGAAHEFVREDVLSGMNTECAGPTWPVAGSAPPTWGDLDTMEPSSPDATMPSATRPPDPESSSLQLVQRLRVGDADAKNRLFARYLEPLQRWAHGRLPPSVRSMASTQDVVQDGIIRVLRRIHMFRPERPGGFHAYLRTAVRSAIIDQIRRARRRPECVEFECDLASDRPSPYQLAVDSEDRRIYEAALEELSEDDREFAIGRLELGLPYEQLAVALGRRSSEAARLAARRAVEKLAHIMLRLRTTPRE